MRMSIPYGKVQQEFEVPEKVLLHSGETESVPALDNLEEAVLQQLEEPAGTPPLRELARGSRNIVILIEDNTRNTPLVKILPVLVGYLNRNGIPDENISFLTAPAH